MAGTNVRALTFAGADDDVSALLITPAYSEQPGPGMLFVHWGFGDRTSFEREALAYAQAGVTSLLIDAPGFGARKGPRPGGKDAEAMRRYCARFLGDLSRAVAVLSGQHVDPARLGYVGHSLGATIAGAFLVDEPRIHCAVLMTPAGRLSELWLAEPDSANRLQRYDNVANLRNVPTQLLFQFAERDEWITRADADAQTDVVKGTKTVEWYGTDHALGGDALAARAAWLATNLSFPDTPVTPDENILPRSQVRSYRMLKPVLWIKNWRDRRRQ